MSGSKSEYEKKAGPYAGRQRHVSFDLGSEEANPLGVEEKDRQAWYKQEGWQILDDDDPSFWYKEGKVSETGTDKDPWEAEKDKRQSTTADKTLAGEFRDPADKALQARLASLADRADRGDEPGGGAGGKPKKKTAKEVEEERTRESERNVANPAYAPVPSMANGKWAKEDLHLWKKVNAEAALERQRIENEAMGRGRLTNAEADAERDQNLRCLGRERRKFNTDGEPYTEASKPHGNERGLGNITNSEVVRQVNTNEYLKGRLTDAQVHRESLRNWEIYGNYLTNKEKESEFSKLFIAKGRVYEPPWVYTTKPEQILQMVLKDPKVHYMVDLEAENPEYTPGPRAGWVKIPSAFWDKDVNGEGPETIKREKKKAAWYRSEGWERHDNFEDSQWIKQGNLRREPPGPKRMWIEDQDPRDVRMSFDPYYNWYDDEGNFTNGKVRRDRDGKVSTTVDPYVEHQKTVFGDFPEPEVTQEDIRIIKRRGGKAEPPDEGGGGATRSWEVVPFETLQGHWQMLFRFEDQIKSRTQTDSDDLETYHNANGSNEGTDIAGLNILLTMIDEDPVRGEPGDPKVETYWTPKAQWEEGTKRVREWIDRNPPKPPPAKPQDSLDPRLVSLINEEMGQGASAAVTDQARALPKPKSLEELTAPEFRAWLKQTIYPEGIPPGDEPVWKKLEADHTNGKRAKHINGTPGAWKTMMGESPWVKTMHEELLVRIETEVRARLEREFQIEKFTRRRNALHALRDVEQIIATETADHTALLNRTPIDKFIEHAARNTELDTRFARLLLHSADGFDINAEGTDGRTALMGAIDAGNAELAEEVLQMGPVITAAAADKAAKILQPWIRVAAIRADEDKVRALDQLFYGILYTSELLQLLGTEPDDDEEAEKAKERAMAILNERDGHKVYPSATDAEGNTMLKLAGDRRWPQVVVVLERLAAALDDAPVTQIDRFLKAVSTSQFEAIGVLHERGFDINAKGTDGRTALMAAIDAENAKLTKEVLQMGPDITAGDDRKGGTTARWKAWGPINRAKTEGDTEKAAAWENIRVGINDTHQLLQFPRSDYKETPGVGLDPREEAMEILDDEDTELYPNATDADGNTALHLALAAGWDDVATALLEFGPDITRENGNGQTPADIVLGDSELSDNARPLGDKLNETEQFFVEVTQAAQRKGLSLNPKGFTWNLILPRATDSRGDTPLITACRHELPNVVAGLLQNDSEGSIDVYQTNYEGMTAEDYCYHPDTGKPLPNMEEVLDLIRKRKDDYETDEEEPDHLAEFHQAIDAGNWAEALSLIAAADADADGWLWHQDEGTMDTALVMATKAQLPDAAIAILNKLRKAGDPERLREYVQIQNQWGGTAQSFCRTEVGVSAKMSQVNNAINWIIHFNNAESSQGSKSGEWTDVDSLQDFYVDDEADSFGLQGTATPANVFEQHDLATQVTDQASKIAALEERIKIQEEANEAQHKAQLDAIQAENRELARGLEEQQQASFAKKDKKDNARLTAQRKTFETAREEWSRAFEAQKASFDAELKDLRTTVTDQAVALEALSKDLTLARNSAQIAADVARVAKEEAETGLQVAAEAQLAAAKTRETLKESIGATGTGGTITLAQRATIANTAVNRERAAAAAKKKEAAEKKLEAPKQQAAASASKKGRKTAGKWGKKKK